MKTIKVVFVFGIGLTLFLMFIGKPPKNIFDDFVKVVRNIVIGMIAITALLLDSIIHPNAT